MFKKVVLLLCVFQLSQVAFAQSQNDLQQQVNRLIATITASSTTATSRVSEWVGKLQASLQTALVQVRSDIEANVVYVEQEINRTLTATRGVDFDIDHCAHGLDDHLRNMRNIDNHAHTCINQTLVASRQKAQMFEHAFEARLRQAESYATKVEQCADQLNCLEQLQRNISKLEIAIPLMNHLEVDVVVSRIDNTYGNTDEVVECSRKNVLEAEDYRRSILNEFLICVNEAVNGFR